MFALESGSKMVSGVTKVDLANGSGLKARSRIHSTSKMLTLLLVVWCLLFVDPVGCQTNFSSDLMMSDLPDRETRLVQETVNKDLSVLEKGKSKQVSKLKHKQEVKPPSHPPSSNSSLGVRRHPAPPPNCAKNPSIEGAFKYINTVLSCVIFAVGIIGNATLLRIIYQNKSMTYVVYIFALPLV